MPFNTFTRKARNPMQALQNFNPGAMLDTFVSLTTAFVFGALIGLERQVRQRTAGCAPTPWSPWARPSSSTWPCAWAEPRAPRAWWPMWSPAWASWVRAPS
jgi:hypothetical protein